MCLWPMKTVPTVNVDVVACEVVYTVVGCRTLSNKLSLVIFHFFALFFSRRQGWGVGGDELCGTWIDFDVCYPFLVFW